MRVVRGTCTARASVLCKCAKPAPVPERTLESTNYPMSTLRAESEQANEKDSTEQERTTAVRS